MRVVDYNQPPPEWYHCRKCGAHGVKLWRMYMSSYVELHCAECALADQGKKGPVDSEGRRRSDLCGRTDQIGSLVPAVPCEDEETYWGYCAVPEEGVRWWRRIPTTK